MNRPRVLVVDDERGVRESLRMVLKEHTEVMLASSGEEALRLLQRDRVDVILLDILMPDLDGFDVLEQIKDLQQVSQVIMLTATKTVKTAVRAMKLGAFDYITKPFDIDELLLIVDRAVRSQSLTHEVETIRAELGHRYSFDNVVGRCEQMQTILKAVGKVAPLKTTVLLTGESGTGKEVIARAVHYNSPRAERPLVAINCAAIPESLLESELFGHERGALTDAHTRQIGHFERAHRSTIFLDEIAEMNPNTQAKLLRVLEQGVLTRVGGTEPIKVDVRIVAATNRDLAQALATGSLRSDLYFRLNVVSLELPPLRQRREDIPLLIQHFLERKAIELKQGRRSFSPAAVDVLLGYQWPGNVRELENVVERALVLSTEPLLGVEDLPGNFVGSDRSDPSVAPSGTPAESATMSETVDRLEYDMILSALAEADHNQTRAAEILGTTRRILKYKMDKLGIPSTESDSDT